MANHELATAVAARRPVYGRSTGVGANRTLVIDAADFAAHGQRLLRSHAHDAGESLPRGVIRAAMFVRANQLAQGGAGLRPDLLDALLSALRDGRVPRVSRLAGIGTGDLALLAQLALAFVLFHSICENSHSPSRLAMQGEVPWDDGLVHSYLPGKPFGPDDALPFMSSNAPTIALATLAAGQLARTLDAALAVAALSFVSLRGNQETLSAHVHARRPHPGQVAVAARLRALLAGAAPAARLQDPYGLRCLPQGHGPLVDALAHLNTVLEVEMNASAENPLFVADDALHHGGFHQAQLATTMDHVRLCAAQVAALALARLTKMHDPAFTGQRAFLAAGPVGTSGTMMLEYTAAAALADVRHAALPVTLQSVVLSLGMEDHAAWAWHAAEQLHRLDSALRQLVGCELVIALRSLRLAEGGAERPVPPALVGAYAVAMKAVPHIEEDHRLTDDVAAAVRVLDSLAPFAAL